MKIFYLTLFVFLLSVDAQRRSVKSELLSENEPQLKSARRGRARFTATADSPQTEEHRNPDPVSRRLVSRRRPESHSEAAPARRGYEVDEVVDEVPVETFRKHSRAKVLTENKFEAKNAPPSNSLFQPSTTESIDDIIKSIGTDIFDTTSSSVPVSSTVSTSLEPQPSELTSSEISKIDNEISRTQPETTTPLSTKRSNGRFRSNSVANAPTSAPTLASRARARTRPTRKPEEQNSPPTAGRTVHRGTRRRIDTPSVESRTRGPSTSETVSHPVRSRTVEARTRGPSVIASAESVELPSRSRSGRRIATAARRIEEPKSPERVTLDITPSRRTSTRKGSELTTIRSRARGRSREVPPVIDEQKLEVLPLFERESKTVRPVRKFVTRRRNLNSAEEVETSATENDVKVAPKPPRQSVVVETRTESSVKRRKVINKIVSRTSKPTTKSTVKTTTKPTVVSTKAPTKPTKPSRPSTKATLSSTKSTLRTIKPLIKESVVSEITEVTSKRTITRSKPGRTKTELPKFVPRGSIKPDTTLSNVKKNKSSLTSSEEEIDDTDNYPEQFKALIQAKKQKKESRSPQRHVTASPAVTKTTEKVVNSSPSTTTQVTSSEANRQLEDSENELDPSKTSRTTRRRFSQTTEKTPRSIQKSVKPTEKITRPTRKSKFARSTTVVPLPTPEHRFHAKFNNEPEAKQETSSSSPVKSGRGFSPKPPRGLYSSRKTKESYTKNKSTTAQIPILKKSSRYSSRYRNDASSRGAIRTSTNAPAYLPTIPTITPPTTSVKSPVAYQDKDLGVEVISFDDPVNTVPSANLVSGEYLASSTENHLTSPLVSASQTKTTEKPVSIIERIINSITAISTTEVPDVTKQTTPSHENQTKQSAILKLATKKSTRLDKTQTTQKIPTVTVTSEKPTTIIERILSSLSAIQADNTTDTKHLKSKQVGTNFNTISSPSTTPLTRVTKSTLYAPISTTVNPLYVLDDISNDQILQKRTIDKLLVLLNTLASPSPHPTPLVVVTPKTTSYVVGTSAATTATTSTAATTTISTTTEPTTTTTTTTRAPTTTTTTTTSQLFTSPTPNVSLNTRANISPSTNVSLSSRVNVSPSPNVSESTATTLPAIRYTSTPTYTTLSTQAPTTFTFSTTTPISTSTLYSISTPTHPPILTSTEVGTTSPVATSTASTTDISNEIGANPLSIDSGVTSLPTVTETSSNTDPSTISSLSSGIESTTTSSVDSSTPVSSTLPTTEFTIDNENNFVFPSTIVPALINFEVSPGSVSVFSANDISNAITPENFASTVTISGRANFPESLTSTQATTSPQITTIVPNSTDSNTTTQTQTSVNVESRFGDSSTSTTPSGTTTDSVTMPPSTLPTITTVPPSTTVASATSSSGTTDSATLAPSTTTVGTTSLPSTTIVGATSAPSTTPVGTAATTTLAPATTTLAPTTTDSTAASNTTQDISSNIIDTTDLPEKSNQTSTVNPSTNITSRTSGRSGRLLNIVQDPVQNSIDTSTVRPKDYFIFAVLNNNTVLRKRPSRFPTKETPYLVVGVYPNNTIVRKFPNGTLVPMEPIVRVSGFDTRENPPPLPEITSNQVTPDQGSRPDNKNLQTVEQNTVPPFEANPLSLSSVNNATSTTGTTPSSAVPSVQANPLSISISSSTTTESSTSTSTISSSSSAAPATSTTSGTTTSSTAPTATLPTLTEILNGRTVQAFNSIINISDLSKTKTLEVDPKSKATTTTIPTPTLSNRILEDPISSTTFAVPTTTITTTAVPTTTTTVRTTTTNAPTTTTTIPTTTIPPTTATLMSTKVTTVLPLSQPATTTYRTTTSFPSTTFFPQFLTTLFSTLRPRRVFTEAPIEIVTPISNRVRPSTTPRVEISTGGDLATASSTRRTIRTTTEPPTTTFFSTLPVSTTVRSRRRGTTTSITTTQPTTTTVFTTNMPSTTVGRNARRSTAPPEITTTNATKKLKQLTEQQKKDLQTLAQLEMEQAAILKQLAFLTNLNFANTKPTTDKNDLASRIVALAVEQDKERHRSSTAYMQEKRQGKKISASGEHTVEQLVRQLSIATPSTITKEYGNSNDAIIAALLKEQGIGPTTPKVLEDVYSLTTTSTRKPKTTTRRPGPLMQSLNWLLNVLAPPTTRRPKPKSKPTPKPKPKPKPEETSEELLTHQPTHLTPVVTPAPRQNIVSSLSQTDVQKLIKQLEAIQKDPQGSKGLDFSSIQSLQGLINTEGGVKVTSSGTTGTTTRETTPMTTSRRKSKARVAKSTTAIPVSVSNSIAEEDFATTTTRAKITLPPVRLRPVPGLEDDDTMVRGQLISAAVNVTRAISSFLGTALQGAATGFQSLLGSGSRVVGSLMQVSSNTSSRPG